jgi:hypothetical protein
MKKRKVDIMKNLNKITPKLLRSLIELNDFNDVSDFSKHSKMFTACNGLKLINETESLRRRKSKGSSSLMNESNNKGFRFHRFENPLVAVCSFLEGVIVVESLERKTNW